MLLSTGIEASGLGSADIPATARRSLAAQLKDSEFAVSCGGYQ